MSNHLRPMATLAALSAGMLLIGCGNDVAGQSAPSTTATPTTIVVVTSVVTVPDTSAPSTTAASATTTATAPTTTPTTSPLPATPPGGSALDWDGVRYDFGRITGLSSSENEDLITFDRYQLYGDNGELQSASDFTEEPVVVGNSDLPWVNDNTRQRTYVIDPDAEVLTLANSGRLECGGNEGEAPEWQSNTVDDLFAAGTPDSDQVSLMFGGDGRVTLIRVSESC